MTNETYERAELLITSFDTVDVITTSDTRRRIPINEEYEIVMDR